MREADQTGYGDDRKDCQRRFKAAWEKLGEPVAAVATNERDALAMAILWKEQGFSAVELTDSVKTYTAEEYATKVLNS
jgi:IS1 family transposase